MRSVARSVVVLALLPTALVGCSTTVQTEASPSSTVAATAAPSTQATWQAKADASANQAAFDALLQPLVNPDGVPDEHDVVNALRGVGLTTEQLQVTPSVTPTGLPADTLSVSAEVQGQCLVGQYHKGTYGGSAVVDPIDGACLVGQTLTIDW